MIGLLISTVLSMPIIVESIIVLGFMVFNSIMLIDVVCLCLGHLHCEICATL